ncbi:MAG TPA: outer membrane protein assembly factor BamA, partial [Vicinamibacterales bacterium]|nr:outer membrane protein assembly factor BamA [Vicinamibacterales bacterium]
EFLRTLFKINEGDVFSRKALNKGIEKATEAYGSAGFYQATPAPDFVFRDVDPETGQPLPGEHPAIVDINMKFQEGTQFFINRITFHGNTTTLDQVIRREMRIAEGGVFNTLGLRESIRRLNQLGYFKPLENAEAIKVTEVPGQTGRVDVGLTFEEQNRNSISFGAGVSQFDGFFGQLSFQTSNFLGRGETVGISLQRGSQARNYQVSFSEPYLFDRPITAGFDIFRRQFHYIGQYTQDSTGTNTVVGFPIADYTRMFMGYSYEKVTIRDINPLYLQEEVLASNPFLRDSLLIASGGKRTVSKISPSVVHNTVNQPIFPSAGRRLTADVDFAGLGGNSNFWQTRFEAIQFIPFTNRLSLGMRAEVQYVRPFGSTLNLPIFERYFLGGEYSVRGFDLRTIGPRDQSGQIVLGGNKTMLFNAEFNINIAGPVRLLAFYDAGQVRDIGENFGWWEDVTEIIPPPRPVLYDPLTTITLREFGTLPPVNQEVVIGRRNAFKTSTGLELRFFMPVLNVPFRLIAAYNPQRGGVLNNSLQPQPKFTFRFAVGTTF